MDLLSLFRRKAAATASELTEARTVALQDLQAVEAALAQHREGDEAAALRDIEAARAHHQVGETLAVDVRLLRARLRLVEDALAQARLREATIDLSRRAADAAATLAAVEKRLRREYPALAGRLRHLAEAAWQAEQARRAVNQALKAAGRTDRIAPIVDEKGRPWLGAWVERLALPNLALRSPFIWEWRTTRSGQDIPERADPTDL